VSYQFFRCPSCRRLYMWPAPYDLSLGLRSWPCLACYQREQALSMLDISMSEEQKNDCQEESKD